MHPARKNSFDYIYSNLEKMVEEGYVFCKKEGDLALYCYTKRTVYEKFWNEWTEMARGLILDISHRKVIATPFLKFFNYGEKIQTFPDQPFSTFEKVDGSLIIVYYYGGKWRAATKGSFNSDQAVMAQKILDESDLRLFFKGDTYLFELIGPSNKIVVRYPEDELIFLGGYTANGLELSYSYIYNVGWENRFRSAIQYPHKSFNELAEIVKNLSSQEEGFVIRFDDGTRLKMKGEQYMALHRCISMVTPLEIWRQMRDNGHHSLIEFRKKIPEEFWEDFDNIHHRLEDQNNRLVDRILTADHAYRDVPTQELYKYKDEIGDVIHYLYRIRSGKAETLLERRSFFETFKPKGNYLPGYTPSSSIRRFEMETQ